MTGNWYCMRRGWQEHEFFAPEPFTEREAWEWLIGNAAWKETIRRNGKGERVTIQRGQIHVSDRSLASAWRWDKKRVRRTIEKFVDGKMLDQSRDQSGTVLTVVNYAAYQDLSRLADVVGDNREDQPRDRSVDQSRDQSGDHTRTNKPGEPVKKGAPSYAFEGRWIRLNQRDFDAWRTTYHAIVDLHAELAAIDHWFDGKDDTVRKSWWSRTPRMLNTKHQQMITRAGQPQQGAAIHTIDEAFERRLARFQAGQETGEAQGQ